MTEKLFTPSADSLNRLKVIMQNMKERSFHDHYHILFDIRSSMDKEEVTYLEIGAFAGGSASLMASHPKKTKVFSIDLGQPIAKSVVQENVEYFKNPENPFFYFEGNSQDRRIVDQVQRAVKKVDILFIDGDHTYDGVKHDYNNYKDLVQEGGYIVFDDYMDWQYSPDVKHAVDDIMATLDTDQFEIIGSLVYPELQQSNTPIESSNEYIIRKKITSKPKEEKETPVVPITKPTPAIQNEKKLAMATVTESIEENEQNTKVGYAVFLLESKLRNIQQKQPSEDNDRKIKQLKRSIAMLTVPYQ